MNDLFRKIVGISKEKSITFENLDTVLELELKLKHKDQDWRIGYTFDSKRPVKEVSEFNEIQKNLIEKEESPFNKNPLVTQLTYKGNRTLTDTTSTEWAEGELRKDKIDCERFKELTKLFFGIE
ncbi:arylamine N-acetyltransferase (plasmid) [Bacillus sp. CMF21]|nr:arylamine N-acetyltransferase [Bacillus sp. CMF21]